MDNYTNTIIKLNSLPENLLSEVNDFIDNLAKKNKIKNKTHHYSDENLAELDMKDYLNNLTEYETLLADGKIKW